MLSSSSLSSYSDSSSSSFSPSSSDSSYLKKVHWVMSKPVVSALPAISNGDTNNRLFQTINLLLDNCSITRIACYLGRVSSFSKHYSSTSVSSLSSGMDYNVVLSVYKSDAEGKPDVLLESSSISARTITKEGWYYFDFSLLQSLEQTNARKISIVFYQDGGGEDDYVTWFYTNQESAVMFGPAGLSNNGSDWLIQSGVSRIFQIIDGADIFVNAYDSSDTSEDHFLRTSPGKLAKLSNSGINYLSLGEFKNTDITQEVESISSSGTEDRPYVRIAKRDMAISFVLDESGSMGWNDRVFRRNQFIREAIRYFKDNYHTPVVFDIVSFGGKSINDFKAISNGNTPSVIVDIHNPNSDSKLNNDDSFPQLSDGVVAYGFKRLASGSAYLFSYIFAENYVVDDGVGLVTSEGGGRVAINYQNLGLGSLGISIEPDSEISSGYVTKISVHGGEGEFRKPFLVNRQLATSGLLTPIIKNVTTSFQVDNPTSLSNKVDIVDRNGFVYNQSIVAVNSNVLTLGNVLPISFDISSVSAGLVQESAGTPIDFSEKSSIEIRFKVTNLDGSKVDAERIQPVIFYLQTAKGGCLEYLVKPLDSWSDGNVFYIDDIAVLRVGGIDSNGRLLPDNTEIQMVGELKVPPAPQYKKMNVSDDYPHPTIGSFRIFVSLNQNRYGDNGSTIYRDVSTEKSSIESYSVGDLVTLIGSDGRTESGHVITDISIENGYIDISPPVAYIEEVVSFIVEKPPEASLAGELAPITISAVDVTPIVVRRDMPSEFVLPGDPPPVKSLPSDFKAYNQDDSRRMDGHVTAIALKNNEETELIAGIYVLPITEDSLFGTIYSASQSAMWLNAALSDKEKAELQLSQQKYLEKKSEQKNDESQEESSDSNAKNNKFEDGFGFKQPGKTTFEDFVIDNPVFTHRGYATSRLSLTSYKKVKYTTGVPPSRKMCFKDKLGRCVDGNGGALAIATTLKPWLISRDSIGNIKTAQEMSSINVVFLAPYNIESRTDPNMFFTSPPCTDEHGEIYYVNVPGCYATETDKTVKIDYQIFERNRPMNGGVLRIKFYDADRSLKDMEYPGQVVPTFDGFCSPNWTPDEACRLSKSSLAQEDTNMFDDEKDVTDKAQEATYIDGYVGEFQVPIIHGAASVSIPTPSVVAHIIVRAELVFPDNEEISVVKNSHVWYRNPLELELMMPSFAVGGYDQPPFEIGALVSWMGKPVEDNISVGFSGSVHKRYLQSGWEQVEDPSTGLGLDLSSPKIPQSYLDRYRIPTDSWPPTPIVPSVSKTANNTGVASGCFIGPHGPVAMHIVKKDGEAFQEGDKETVSATANHNGFSAKVYKKIEWIGKQLDVDDPFYFSVRPIFNSMGVFYTDGWDKVWVLCDLAASEYLMMGRENLIPGLVGRDFMGNPSGPSWRIGKPSIVNITKGGGSKKWEFNRQSHPSTGELLGEVGNETFYGWALSNPISMVSFCDPNCVAQALQNPDNKPRGFEVSVSTVAYTEDHKFIVGYGCKSDSITGCIKVDGEAISQKDIFIPIEEPLQSSMKLFERDPSGRVRAIFEVKFSGRPIPLVAFEHSISTSMPEVVFDVYKKKVYLQPDGKPQFTGGGKMTTTEEKIYSSDISLSQFNVILSLRAGSFGEGHYHDCKVDAFGNGVTTTTYSETGDVLSPGHNHEIHNYVVQTVEAHEHDIHSIAETFILPFRSAMPYATIIEARVVYDASSTYVYRWAQNFDQIDPFWSNENNYSLEIVAPPSAMTQRSVDSNGEGFLVKAVIKASEELPSSDYARVSFEFIPLLPAKKTEPSGNSVVFRKSGDAYEPRDYLYLRINASCSIGEQVLSATKTVRILSQDPWVPSRQALVAAPTSDIFYLNKALSLSNNCYGGSPLYDAVLLAASRLISWQFKEDISNRCRALKMIFLLTDGAENLSISTLNQSINAVNRISGQSKTPVLPVVLGIPSSFSKLILDQYADQTGGGLTNLVINESHKPESSSADDYVIQQTISEIVFKRLFSINAGSYINVVDLGSPKYLNLAYFSVSLPEKSKLLVRFRFSDDGEIYGPWSKWTSVSGSRIVNFETSGMDRVKRFLMYELSFFGNDVFESPRFREINTSFVEPRNHVIFFAPIDLDLESDEFVNDLVINHKASTAPLTTIGYGALQAASVDENDFFSDMQPLARSGHCQILLNRYNESTYTADYIKYYAVNGGWAASAKIEVHSLLAGASEGKLVDPMLYTVNPKEGSISFLSIQDRGTRFLISVMFSDQLRLTAMVTNYSNSSFYAAKIYHIGVTYNVSKRVLRDSSGRAIRRPISDLITSSSESSPESFSSGH